MIVSRTPVRLSFFGGGTDYPAWFSRYGGSVLSTTIDRYSYISCRYLPPFFEHRSRIVWSRIELVREIDEIQHPAVRESLRFMGIREGVEIHYDGDLPARTGVGSSSAFTVGLLHALCALRGEMPTKLQLARAAIHVEQSLIGECVGSQDQTAAAFGGFNRIDFQPDGSLDVHPVILPQGRLADLEAHLLVVFTGFSRCASDIAARQIAVTPSRVAELTRMRAMVDDALAVLTGGGDLADFGRLLHEGWSLKRSLTPYVSTLAIDGIYERARAAGALGGKLLGAGGGGFALLFVRPEERARVIAALDGLMPVPFHMESGGSQIIVYQPEDVGEGQMLRGAAPLARPDLALVA